MSDPKDFLSRWSQRKLKPEPAKPAATDEQPASPADGTTAETPATTIPEFDISSLPSLESIGAESDVRMFMQPGVPASLTRAALRRAWSADPAIRDFVGLSENSWDFNAPNSIPGFGSISADEVKQAAARFFNVLTDETTGQAAPKTVSAQGDITPEIESPAEPPHKAEQLAAAAPARQPADDAAVQQSDTEGEEPPNPLPRRRHGTALPE